MTMNSKGWRGVIMDKVEIGEIMTPTDAGETWRRGRMRSRDEGDQRKAVLLSHV